MIGMQAAFGTQIRHTHTPFSGEHERASSSELPRSTMRLLADYRSAVVFPVDR